MHVLKIVFTHKRHINNYGGVSPIGIYSGSMYRWSLLKDYFPGEGVQNGRVIAVKIHETGLSKFGRAIILIRNPYDAFVAEANRQSSGSVGHVNGDVFETEGKINNAPVVLYCWSILCWDCIVSTCNLPQKGNLYF